MKFYKRGHISWFCFASSVVEPNQSDAATVTVGHGAAELKFKNLKDTMQLLAVKLSKKS